MKKLLLFSFCALFASALFAQITVDDFEGGAIGWGPVEADIYAPIVNAYKEGINPSNNVMIIIRGENNPNYAGAILNPYVQQGYKYLHAYMWRNNENVPNLKVSDTNARDLEPMNEIVPAQWQDVVFDISDYETSGIEFIFFMVDRTDPNTWSHNPIMFVDEVQLSNDPTPRTDVAGDKYNLVWNVDFMENTLPANWNIEVNGNGGGNNELQYYCEKGVSVGTDPKEGKHCLILTATKESYKGKDCTSGRVNTLEHTYFQYGKIEARIWFPNTANGLWPAFWMMGNDFNQVGWPACGETDIVELGNSGGFNDTQDRYFNGASHWGPNWQTHYQEAKSIVNSFSVEDGFHIFTCIWTPENVAMYVDRDAHPNKEPYYQLTITPSSADNAPGKYFHKPNFIILNLAVGGNFPQIWDINGITALAGGPRSMYVDWIRIYQRGDAGESFHSDVPSESLEETTSLVESSQLNVPSAKIVRDGQLLILRGERVYTITGQQLQ